MSKQNPTCRWQWCCQKTLPGVTARDVKAKLQVPLAMVRAKNVARCNAKRCQSKTPSAAGNGSAKERAGCSSKRCGSLLSPWSLLLLFCPTSKASRHAALCSRTDQCQRRTAPAHNVAGTKNSKPQTNNNQYMSKTIRKRTAMKFEEN